MGDCTDSGEKSLLLEMETPAQKGRQKKGFHAGRGVYYKTLRKIRKTREIGENPQWEFRIVRTAGVQG